VGAPGKRDGDAKREGRDRRRVEENQTGPARSAPHREPSAPPAAYFPAGPAGAALSTPAGGFTSNPNFAEPFRFPALNRTSTT